MRMREKIARAMCDGNWDARSFNETPNGETPEEQREYWLDKADAALDQIMDPSREIMIEIERCRARRSHLAAALIPFSVLADSCEHLAPGSSVSVNIDKCRTARAMLRGDLEDGNEKEDC